MAIECKQIFVIAGDSGVEIPAEVQTQALEAHVAALKSGVDETYDYRPVLTKAYSALRAPTMPSILLAYNSAMAVLGSPDIADQLPQEVSSRRFVANQLIANLAESVVEEKDYVDAHREHFDLTLSEVIDIRRANRIDIFAGSIMNDCTPVMGGAARFLLQQDVEPELVIDLVGRSPIARRMSTTAQMDVSARGLGDTYCDPQYYQWVDSADEPTLDITFAAQQKFASVQTLVGGCPARRVSLPAVKRSLFTQTWRQTAAYLLQPSFTVNEGAVKPATNGAACL